MKQARLRFLFVISLISAFGLGTLTAIMAQAPPKVWHSSDQILPGQFGGDSSSEWIFPGRLAAGNSISANKTGANAASSLSLGWGKGDFAAIQVGLWGQNQKPLVLQAGGGSVGIGTSSPQAKLDVWGNLRVDGSITATAGQKIYKLASGCSDGVNTDLTTKANCKTVFCGWAKIPGGIACYWNCDATKCQQGAGCLNDNPVSCSNSPIGIIVKTQ